ncbi:MAG: helix-turn-helix transcriptional regulator [Anaerolineae bacterium]|nr:helix-turn-helix transcriptional regulator [Anaerolineae bacterium]
MHRELLLLGLLRNEDMHGYRLTEFIAHDMAFCTDLKKPTAYHLLRKMAADGLIDESEEQAGNRPARTVYRITAAGEARFQTLLRENLGQYQSTHFAGDIGLAFIDALPQDEAHAFLRQRHAAISAEIEHLSQIAGQAHQAGGLALVFDHYLHHLRSESAWLAAVLAGEHKSSPPG